MFTKVGRVLLLFLALNEEVWGHDEADGRSNELVIIPKKDVSARLGHPINISCFAKDDRPLQSCRWERLPLPSSGSRYFVKLDRGNTNIIEFGDERHCNCSYRYLGKGLDKGDCTLSIQNVTEFHISEWQCQLFDGNKSNTWSGNLRISVKEESSSNTPYFQNSGVFQEIVCNETQPTRQDVVCCVAEQDSNAPLSLRISLVDSVNFHSNLTRKEDSGHTDYENSRACRTASFTFWPEDNGKFIVCNATYYINHIQSYELRTEQLRVKYPPKLFSNEPYQEHIPSNDRMIITFSFMSNPMPCVTWRLFTDKDDIGSFEISDHHVKYKPGLYHTGGDNYTANLTIFNFQAEDYNRKFMVNVSNDIGSKSLRVTIISPAPGNERDAFWTMVILGVGAVLLMVLVALVICIVIENKRTRKREYNPGVIPKQQAHSRRINKRNNDVDKKDAHGTDEPVELESSV